MTFNREMLPEYILMGILVIIVIIVGAVILTSSEDSAADYMQRVDEAMTTCLGAGMYTRDECLSMAMEYAQDDNSQPFMYTIPLGGR